MSEHTQDTPLIPWPALVEYMLARGLRFELATDDGYFSVSVYGSSGCLGCGYGVTIQIAVERCMTRQRTQSPTGKLGSATQECMAELAREMGYEVKE